ncbi:alkaline ceramidase [Enterocloster clostridioformis]|uniref:neutral/alkaline non-lysosomal ceramidase N-terminal domain-containing protein n=1 Tax=Enterocloster clostridioformis TaxID=1531 RepID=UPI00080C77CF|nr:neutral/alkaline non-lysosomal ceramidase N-terminal domain-containing protein [Enterocloster clostridioformis]ANU46153.1 alkaline ceramidase [Lachnoclostridium sp. YL32]NDO29978.1 alkaline ceramidase [Enterocloster clostridioformis]OXE67352.1 alkaline ceramidase [Enterocloster clostridioformis]QQQ99104.1 neutral/alkaline non-lysosomal ceramidase N-terminal domain-containing protein [Enterocloster clostridioformis]
MKVGHARYDLTPAEGTEFYLLGYKNPERGKPAKGIHDHIFCNALLFEQDGETAFLWTADLLELEDDMAEEAKTRLNERFGIDRDHIVLAVMHDHSSIRDYHKNWPVGKFSQAYYDFLMETICNCYCDCEKNMQKATARWGSSIVTGYYSNRNHPGELADNEVIVVRFYDTEDKPFAAIVNWAVHSTALGASNMYLTGDLAGNTCRKLGETWGYYPLMLNGAGGDSSNRNDRKGKDFAELDRASSGLCEAIAKIPTDKRLVDGRITCQTLSHAIYPNPHKYREELERTIAAIESGTLHTVDDMPASHLLEKCREQLSLPPQNLLLSFGVLDIGGLRLFVFPGELGAPHGKALKRSSGKPALVAGYANGFHYYFLAKEDYGISFETIGNPVPAGEAEKIVEKLIRSGKLLDLEAGTYSCEE